MQDIQFLMPSGPAPKAAQGLAGMAGAQGKSPNGSHSGEEETQEFGDLIGEIAASEGEPKAEVPASMPAILMSGTAPQAIWAVAEAVGKPIAEAAAEAITLDEVLTKAVPLPGDGAQSKTAPVVPGPVEGAIRLPPQTPDHGPVAKTTDPVAPPVLTTRPATPDRLPATPTNMPPVELPTGPADVALAKMAKPENPVERGMVPAAPIAAKAQLGMAEQATLQDGADLPVQATTRPVAEAPFARPLRDVPPRDQLAPTHQPETPKPAGPAPAVQMGQMHMAADGRQTATAAFEQAVQTDATASLDSREDLPVRESATTTTQTAAGQDSSAAPRANQANPARAIQMIAENAQRLTADRPVELRLSPEELGTVRLTLQAQESGVSIAIAVERPETLELMRRHMDLLSQSLREAGYTDIQFSLGGGETANKDKTGEQGREHQGEAREFAAGSDDAPPIQRRATTIGAGRLDMRL